MLKKIWARFKFVIWLAIILAVILAGIGVGIWARGCGRQGSTAPAPAKGVPAGWHQAGVVTAPAVENPFKKSPAGKKLEKFPPGSELVEVVTPSGETVQIAILPGGEVVVPDGYDATVYKKPAALVALEVRPWIGAGAEGYVTGIGVAAAAGCDVVRAWKFHGGPAAAVSWEPRLADEKPRVNVAGGLAGAFNLTRNIDARAAGMYGTAGAAAFVGVDIAIVKTAAP
jgi:hypothetical protein